MAKRGKKAKKKPRARAKRRSFRMPTLERVVERLERRKERADAVVKALKDGGKAVSTPGFNGLTPLQEANRVANGLEKAIQQLTSTCPNDLSSNFVIDVKKRR